MMILQRTTKDGRKSTTTLEGMLWIPNNGGGFDDSISSLECSISSLFDDEEDEDGFEENEQEEPCPVKPPPTKTHMNQQAAAHHASSPDQPSKNDCSRSPRGTPTRSTGGRIPRRQRASLPELRCGQLHLASPRVAAVRRACRRTISADQPPVLSLSSSHHARRSRHSLPTTLVGSTSEHSSSMIYNRFLASPQDDGDDGRNCCATSKGKSTCTNTTYLSGSARSADSQSDYETAREEASSSTRATPSDSICNGSHHTDHCTITSLSVSGSLHSRRMSLSVADHTSTLRRISAKCANTTLRQSTFAAARSTDTADVTNSTGSFFCGGGGGGDGITTTVSSAVAMMSPAASESTQRRHRRHRSLGAQKLHHRPSLPKSLLDSPAGAGSSVCSGGHQRRYRRPGGGSAHDPSPRLPPRQITNDTLSSDNSSLQMMRRNSRTK